MILGDAIPELVVVDPVRRRYRLLVPIPTVAEPTRAAYLAGIVKYVNFRFIKAGVASGGAFDATALSADTNGWFTVP